MSQKTFAFYIAGIYLFFDIFLLIAEGYQRMISYGLLALLCQHFAVFVCLFLLFASVRAVFLSKNLSDKDNEDDND